MGEGQSLIPNKGWHAGDGGHGHPTFTGHCQSDPTTVSTLLSCSGISPRGGAQLGVRSSAGLTDAVPRTARPVTL